MYKQFDQRYHFLLSLCELRLNRLRRRRSLMESVLLDEEEYGFERNLVRWSKPESPDEDRSRYRRRFGRYSW